MDTLLKTTTPRVDRTYITTYYRRFHLYVVSDRQDYQLRLRGLPQFVTYKPNLAWALGIGVDYRWLGTELTIKLPFLGYDIARRGRTKPFGVSFNLNNRRLWFSSQYQAFRGLYLHNPDVLEPDWLNQHPAYPQREDLRSRTVTANVRYLFNPLKVSIPASLMQREAQRKNAGSWVVGGFLTYQHIRADSSLIPTPLRPEFSADAQLSLINLTALGVDGGYIQTIVFGNHLFTSVSLRPGLAMLLQQTSTPGGLSTSHVSAGWQGVASLTVGYSSDVYYGGLYSSATLFSRPFADGLIDTYTGYVRLVAGKRIRYRTKGILTKVPGL